MVVSVLLEEEKIPVSRDIVNLSNLFRDALEDHEGNEDEEIPLSSQHLSREMFHLAYQWCKEVREFSRSREQAGDRFVDQFYKHKMLLNREARSPKDILTEEDLKFFKSNGADGETETTFERLIDLTNTANYLDMPSLQDACCALIALDHRR